MSQRIGKTCIQDTCLTANSFFFVVSRNVWSANSLFVCKISQNSTQGWIWYTEAVQESGCSRDGDLEHLLRGLSSFSCVKVCRAVTVKMHSAFWMVYESTESRFYRDSWETSSSMEWLCILIATARQPFANGEDSHARYGALSYHSPESYNDSNRSMRPITS